MSEEEITRFDGDIQYQPMDFKEIQDDDKFKTKGE